ncbi:hypothetical protein [Pedobacter gandavensis]|uniref:hypothetical protein n=1 Tax=Pedobacter gandavensis TaxID=2679963 RepID=UPI00292EE198|nr:hypothetical protein [Pedobacter gandavensis]
MKNKYFRLLMTFYSSFFPATLLISIACASLFAYLGNSSLTMLFWFKVFTLGIVMYYISNYKSKEFLYYQNLGISKSFLWTVTMILEFLMFAFLFVLSAKYTGISIDFYNLFI